jgi:hypothetical protein
MLFPDWLRRRFLFWALEINREVHGFRTDDTQAEQE